MSLTIDQLETLVRDQAERLQRLEQRIEIPALMPLRVSRNEAAKLLRVNTRTISVYVSRGLLVKLPKPSGAPKTATTFFDPANVEALAKSEDHAREWVASRKYVTHKNRAR